MQKTLRFSEILVIPSETQRLSFCNLYWQDD